MRKAIILVILALIVRGGLFAQETPGEVPPREKAPPMNTFSVDAGPLITGAAGGAVLGRVISGASGSGFGIAAQYERQFTPYFSAAARFAYMGLGLSISEISMNAASYSVEGHGRFYPFGESFFLDLMLGYANFAMTLSGKGFDDMNSNGNYFKLGGKLGWRIDFGKPGGFVFEPAFGYSAGIGGGNRFDITTGYEDSPGYEQIKDFVGNVEDSLNTVKDLLANYVFVGGPRMTLGLGWRF
jgi:hypothetical protein